MHNKQHNMDLAQTQLTAPYLRNELVMSLNDVASFVSLWADL